MPRRTGAPVRRRAWLALALVPAMLGTGRAPVVRAEPAASGAWSLTFSDEFDGNRVDNRKWGNGFGWGEAARATFGYCDAGNNTVSGGVLRQRIERRARGGKPFTIGCLHTRGRFAQQHGFFEARIWAAGCYGARAAFWGKPADESWPPELDVVEVHGDEPNVARLTQYYHDGQRIRRSQAKFTGPDFTAGFHVFAAKWGPDETIWYVDGQERRRTSDGARQMNAGGPFYMMVNAQVFLPNSTCGRDAYDTYQLVDYVRVWERQPAAPDLQPYPDPTAPQPLTPQGRCAGLGVLRSEPDLPDGLGEASGMAASRRRPDWGWFIRDSGNPASLYAFREGAGGRVDAVRELPVAGASNRDWEDLVYDPGPASSSQRGQGRLWVVESGQTGTNRFLYQVPEPDPAGDRFATAQRFRYAYPDQQANTEAGFMLGGRLALVTKTAPARVYVFRRPLRRGVVNYPSFAGVIPGADRVSVVRASSDGRLLVAASHRTLHLYRGLRPLGARLALRGGLPADAHSIGRTAAVEAGDFLPADSCRLLLFSENRQVFRAQLGSP